MRRAVAFEITWEQAGSYDWPSPRSKDPADHPIVAETPDVSVSFARLGLEDLIDFYSEPEANYAGIPLKQICRDDACMITEVHRVHPRSSGQPRGRYVPCYECSGTGLDRDEQLRRKRIRKCMVCLGSGRIPRILLAMERRR